MEMEKSKVLIQFLLFFRQSGDVLFFLYARRLRGYTATVFTPKKKHQKKKPPSQINESFTDFLIGAITPANVAENKMVGTQSAVFADLCHIATHRENSTSHNQVLERIFAKSIKKMLKALLPLWKNQSFTLL